LNWKTDVFAVGFKEKKKIVKQEGRVKKKRNVLIKTLFRILVCQDYTAKRFAENHSFSCSTGIVFVFV